MRISREHFGHRSGSTSHTFLINRATSWKECGAALGRNVDHLHGVALGLHFFVRLPIPAPTRRAKTTLDPRLDDHSSTTTPNRSWRSPPPETSGSARVRLSHSLFSGPRPSGARV